ncbi:lysis protein [Klebsiella pneumoniae]|uniref:lysis protein n=1 Tax=Klebsiella pneumoniae TaxID=573 RepID=UPI003F818F67
MSRLAAIISAIVICLVVCLGWLASHYHDNATEFKRQRDKATEQLSLAKDTIADMQTRQREVAALDAKYTKELADAKAENDALQRKLDNGGRVLVKGKCPVSASTQTAGAPSMGVVVKFFWTRRSDGRVMHRRATGRQGWPAFRTVRVIGSQVLNAIGYCYKS